VFLVGVSDVAIDLLVCNKPETLLWS